MYVKDCDEWHRKASPVHQRAANRILSGCLKNGGLYIKLGQGLVSFNHILPKEYLTTLEILYDKAPGRTKNEVSQLLFICVYFVGKVYLQLCEGEFIIAQTLENRPPCSP